MKFARVLRLLSIAVILSLLLAAFPAMRVLAFTYDVSIDPEEGKIGDTVEISGEGFPYSTESSEKWVRIFFAKDEADENDNIDTEVFMCRGDTVNKFRCWFTFHGNRIRHNSVFS